MVQFNFTESQLSAIRSFREFLDGSEQVFLLKGAAGTGKTTLVKEFLKIVGKRNRDSRLMAPTGRAAYIIGNKTGKEARTIHRTIYSLRKLVSKSQQAVDDADSMHACFGLKDNRDESLLAVYFVDEASMILDSFSDTEAFSFGSGRLLSDLFLFAGERKIVFIGDFAQLPPVGMNFSPALDREYIEQNFNCQTKEVVLNEVLRQAGDSLLLRNVSCIRDNIEAKNFVEFKLVDGEECIAENEDLLKPYFALSSDRPPVNAAVITYTNQQVVKYNKAIRMHYFGVDAQRILPGELLMISRNNYSWNAELFNGNIVKVVSAKSDAERECKTVYLSKDPDSRCDLYFRDVTIMYKTETEIVSREVKILDNVLDDSSGSFDPNISRALIIDFERRLPTKIKENRSQIREFLKSGSVLNNEIGQLANQYLNLLFEDKYYNAVFCRYGYAMTCHKAQGGEWPNVFVDLFRFGNNSNEDYFRWAYTALTRSSKNIWHYRSPEFNYISKLKVEEIVLSNNIKVSTYSTEADFCGTRFERLRNLCNFNGLTVSEDRTKNYQHIIEFTDEAGQKAKYQLWYNKKGYNGKDILVACSSDELKNQTKELIEHSYAPSEVPFIAPERPFAEKLVSFVKMNLDELGITLLDITKEQNQDVFHLKTDGLAKVIFYYTDKGNYTYMKLVSSLGAEDRKLVEFRKRFI